MMWQKKMMLDHFYYYCCYYAERSLYQLQIQVSGKVIRTLDLSNILCNPRQCTLINATHHFISPSKHVDAPK
jgi:hypothetical protein